MGCVPWRGAERGLPDSAVAARSVPTVGKVSVSAGMLAPSGEDGKAGSSEFDPEGRVVEGAAESRAGPVAAVSSDCVLEPETGTEARGMKCPRE